MLTDYQKKLFNSYRAQIRDEEITLVSVISSGSGNSYGEGVTETESTEKVWGKVGWGSVFEKDETQGGFVEIGDAKVLLGYDDMDKVQEENVYVKTESGSSLAILKVVPSQLSGECLLICKKK